MFLLCGVSHEGSGCCFLVVCRVHGQGIGILCLCRVSQEGIGMVVFLCRMVLELVGTIPDSRVHGSRAHGS